MKAAAKVLVAKAVDGVLPAQKEQSRAFPDDERFGLTAHLRKSAISIPSNVAEGCGREGERELNDRARFSSTARIALGHWLWGRGTRRLGVGGGGLANPPRKRQK